MKFCLNVLLIIILIIILCVIFIFNKLKKVNVKVDEALSGIDVSLAKRYGILTKMVEVIKGYTKHEQDVLINVIKLRENMSLKEMREANEAMNESFKKIDVLAEAYPDLKASENFKTLQLAIIDIEEHLQAARRLYNSNVSLLNQMIEIFPSNIVAKLVNLHKRDFFEASSAEKEYSKIDL